MTRFRDEQEAESGAIRADSPRPRGRRDDQEFSQEVRRAPADGAASTGERNPAGTKRARTQVSKDRPVAGGDQRHPGKGPARAAEAAAHRASDLDPAQRGTSGAKHRRSHGAAIRAALEATGRPRPRIVRAAKLSTRTGSAGGLVR